MRIPNKYLANMFTAGDEKPIISALQKMLALRAYMRSKTVDNELNKKVLDDAGITQGDADAMYHLMAIANYNDRFVIPTSDKEQSRDPFGNRSACGFNNEPSKKSDKLKNLFGGM
jgi:nitrate reductase beta subunit